MSVVSYRHPCLTIGGRQLLLFLLLLVPWTIILNKQATIIIITTEAWAPPTLTAQNPRLSSSSSSPQQQQGPPLISLSLKSNAEEEEQNNKKESIIGIGGRDGFIPDVNSLKKNLIQEAVRTYKLQLLDILATPSSKMKQNRNQDLNSNDDNDVEDRIAAIIEANPVSTTTDSNLLDGMWELAFSSLEGCTAADVLERTKPQKWSSKKKQQQQQSFTEESVLQQQKQKKPWRLGSEGRTSNPFRSRKRLVRLEDLILDDDSSSSSDDDNRNAHIVDITSTLGGLWTIKRRWDIVGLTRTRLDMKLSKVEISFFRNLLSAAGSINTPDTKQSKSKTQHRCVHVLYLDSDLCISTTTSTTPPSTSTTTKPLNNNDAWNGPLNVYTKSQAWIGQGPKVRRQMRFLFATISWLSSLQSPLRIRERFFKILFYPWFEQKEDNNNDNNDNDNNQILIQRNYYHGNILNGDNNNNDDNDNTNTNKNKNNKSKLTVLKLGDLRLNEDGTTPEDEAWDGDEDPFSQLTPDERQRVLRSMSIREIQIAGNKQRNKSQKDRKKGYRSRKLFQRPSSLFIGEGEKEEEEEEEGKKGKE